MPTFEDFANLDIRVGEITRAEEFPEANKPAYKLWLDFGEQIGLKQSSAQITECYRSEDLMGRQVLAVVNFPPRHIAGFRSDVLVLGIYAEQGVVLIKPDQQVRKGDRLG
jgi:tRNA-binding protein